MSDKMLTVAELAERLHIPRSTAYDLLDDSEGDPQIGFRRIGRRKIVPLTEVETYEKRVFVPARTDNVVPLRHSRAA